jgi:hypothetical protein
VSNLKNTDFSKYEGQVLDENVVFPSSKEENEQVESFDVNVFLNLAI